MVRPFIASGKRSSHKRPFSRGLAGSVACTWRNGASRFSKTILDCDFLNARWRAEFREGVNRVEQSMSATAQMAPHCTTVRLTPSPDAELGKALLAARWRSLNSGSVRIVCPAEIYSWVLVAFAWHGDFRPGERP